ncbi:MAG: hypothetical protein IPL29_00035 [Propionivibrio sp.]|nr:hypothetical protein [Propionivibrio sp.]
MLTPFRLSRFAYRQSAVDGASRRCSALRALFGQFSAFGIAENSRAGVEDLAYRAFQRKENKRIKGSIALNFS